MIIIGNKSIKQSYFIINYKYNLFQKINKKTIYIVKYYIILIINILQNIQELLILIVLLKSLFLVKKLLVIFIT